MWIYGYVWQSQRDHRRQYTTGHAHYIFLLCKSGFDFSSHCCPSSEKKPIFRTSIHSLDYSSIRSFVHYTTLHYTTSVRPSIHPFIPHASKNASIVPSGTHTSNRSSTHPLTVIKSFINSHTHTHTHNYRL